MGLFDRFLKKKEPEAKAPPKKAAPAKKTEKDLATERNEPYIQVLRMDINPDNPSEGSFELDWNDKFITNLMRMGYEGKTQEDMVDRWFQDVCRNIVLETFQQEQADPDVRKVQKRDLGNGRTEVS